MFRKHSLFSSQRVAVFYHSGKSSTYGRAVIGIAKKFGLCVALFILMAKCSLAQHELFPDPAIAPQILLPMPSQMAERYAAGGGGGMQDMYYVPTVVHVIHNNGAENISDAEVVDGIAIINQHLEDNNVNIRLVLAKLDPDANCTNGITHDQISTPNCYTSYGGECSGPSGYTNQLVIKNTNRWDPASYLNIWTVAAIKQCYHFPDDTGISEYQNIEIPATSSPLISLGGENFDLFDGFIVDYKSWGEGEYRGLEANSFAMQSIGNYFNLWRIWGEVNLLNACCDPDPEGLGQHDDHVIDTKPCNYIYAFLLHQDYQSMDTYNCSNVNTGCDNEDYGCEEIPNPEGFWPKENFMGHFFHCSTTFTEGQAERMIECVMTYRAALVSQINMVNTGILEVVNNSWTWNASDFINGVVNVANTISIPAGMHLSIQTGVEVRFSVDAQLIVQPGGKLTLNGCKLTNGCETPMWLGIVVKGTPGQDQNPINYGDQGYLYMNNATIENALYAIDAGYTNAAQGGGIVKAYNSTFRNNQNDVRIGNYHFQTSPGVYAANKSYFSNCTFITDAALGYFGASPNSHVSLKEVNKVKIVNCSFLNTTSFGIYPWDLRGRGIYSIKASFIADGFNNGYNPSPGDDHTTFYRLKYGIYSSGSNLATATFTCKEMEFEHCIYGITNYSTDFVQIYQNNFYLLETTGLNNNNVTERGIYLTNSTGYLVEQNNFYGVEDPNIPDLYPGGIGVWVDNTHDENNHIYNNDFYQLKLGSYVTGDNFGAEDQAGLQIRCNGYHNNRTDIYRAANSTMRHDQGGSQPGGTFVRAGNRFSADPDCDEVSDFVIDPINSQYTNYWCHSDVNTIPICGSDAGDPAIDLLNVDEGGTPLNNATECPNHFSGGTNPNPNNPGRMIAGLNQQRALVAQAVANYNTVVDANEKDNTLAILSAAMPGESQLLRDLLAAHYPLSNEVLRAIIFNASKLNPWHLTEIFLMNSPLPREILGEVGEAEILNSFFMSFLYNADSGASLRRLMELEIGALKLEETKRLYNVSYEAWRNDSDSVVAVGYILQAWQLENDRMGLKLRASNLAANGNFLDAIDLADDDVSLADYVTLLELWQATGGNWELLTEPQKQTLRDMVYYSSSLFISDAYSILQQIGEIMVEPEPVYPVQYRSMHIAGYDENTLPPLIGLSPNPANNECYLYYPIEADGVARIEVYDGTGRIVEGFTPNTKGIVRLKTEDYPAGIYIIRLTALSQELDAVKLTIAH